MSYLLTQDAMPNEIQSGCFFAPSFYYAEDVVRAGGTITGNPLIRNGRVVLDGTIDSVTYALQGWELDTDKISIVIEFWPDFDTDEDENRALVRAMRATGGSQLAIAKTNNTNLNAFRIVVDGSIVADIPEATYSPAWRVGERNVLVVWGTSGNTNAKLNDTMILTAATRSWSGSASLSIEVGSVLGGSFFDGTIGEVRIFRDCLLTEQDAINYYNAYRGV